MKNTLWAGLLLTVLVSACQNPFPLWNPESKSTVDLVVAVEGVGQRTIVPDTMTPASYKLTGTGPSGATVGPITSTTGSISVAGLTLGSWTLNVEGLASDGDTAIVSGSTTLSVTSSTTSASVTLTPTTGNGTLVINLNWTASGRTVTSVTASLFRKGAGINPGPQSMTVTGTTATLTLTGVSAESHFLTLVAKDGAGNVVASNKMETVLIYRGQTSTWNAVLSGDEFKSSSKDITAFNFLAANNATLSANGNVDVNTTVSTTSFTVTLPYGSSTASLTPTMTLSPGATVSPASGTSQVFLSPVTYTVTAEDGTIKIYTVTVNVAPKPEITAFSVAGATGTFSGNNISVIVPFKTDLTISRLFSFTTSAGATVKVGNVTQISDNIYTNFSSTVNYVVTDAYGSAAQTFPVTVSVKAQLIVYTIGSSYYVYRLSGNGATTFQSSTDLGSTILRPIVADPTGAFAFAMTAPGGTPTLTRLVINRTAATFPTSGTALTVSTTARPPQFEPTGKFLYIINDTDVDANKLDYYQLDRAAGTMTANLSGTYAANNYLADFRVFAKGSSTYAVSSRSNVNHVSFYSVDSLGAWTFLNSVNPSTGFDDTTADKKIAGLYVSPSGDKVFGITESAKISSWNVTASGLTGPKTLALTGTPAPSFTGPSTTFPHKLAIHSSGKFAFFLDTANQRIIRIDIASDGTLTQGPSTIVGASENNTPPVSMVFSNDGLSAYVSDPASIGVKGYSVDSDGNLGNGSFTNVGKKAILDRSGNYLIGQWNQTLGGPNYLQVFPIIAGGGIGSLGPSGSVDIGTVLPDSLSIFEISQ